MLLIRKQLKRIARKEAGISLIYVILVGGVTATAAIALGSSLFPACNHVSTLVMRDEVIDIAENCASFALKKLNSLGTTEDLQSVDISKLTPTTYISKDAIVTASIHAANLVNLQTSGLYDPEKFQYRDFSFTPSYRQLTVSASKGNYKHTIQLTLAPVYAPLNGIGLTPQNASSTPLISKAIQSKSTLTIGSGINIPMEDGSPTGANIGTNGLLNLKGATQISGSIDAYSADPNATSIIASKLAIINGDVNSAGKINNTDGTTTNPFTTDLKSPTGNVLGDGKVSSPFGTINDPNTPEFDPNSVKNYSPPVDVPTPTELATITYSGNDPTSIAMSDYTVSTPSGIADLGNLHVRAGDSITLKPGTYIADSVVIDPGATLKIAAPEGPYVGVDIFIQGKGSEIPIDVNGKVSFEPGATPSANNFQLFYNGSKSVNFSLPNSSSMRALVYAPNAGISINFGNNSAFHGATVGNTVSLTGANNGQYFFDPATKSKTSSPGVAAGPNYSLNKSAVSAEPSVKQYRIIAWRELINK